jgi:hypothetical protein
MEIEKLFMQNPELRPYFYGSASAGKASSKEQRKVAFMCEAIFGLVEHAVLQKWYMPRDAWKHCWRPYALERLKQSEELDKFFGPNEHYYSYKMCRVIKSLRRQIKRDREKAAKLDREKAAKAQAVVARTPFGVGDPSF